MRKNWGFTLVELLATVVILGILMSVAVISYTSYVNRNQQTYYQNLEDTVKEAVLDYFADNRSLLPKEVGDTKTVNLQDLVTNKYIDSLVDAKNFPCSGTGVVKKLGANQYDYQVCLSCPSISENIGNGC